MGLAEIKAKVFMKYLSVSKYLFARWLKLISKRQTNTRYS